MVPGKGGKSEALFLGFYFSLLDRNNNDISDFVDYYGALNIINISYYEDFTNRAEFADWLTTILDELKIEIEDEKFNLIEEEISKTTERIRGVEQEIINLENAQKREMYEKSDNVLKKLKIALKNLRGLNLEEKEKLKLKLDNYEEKREKLFAQMLLVAVMITQFSRGANDIANAIAPLIHVVELNLLLIIFS